MRVLRDRKYLSRIGERFGRIPPQFQRTVPGAVWLHAVSVGEVLSAAELIRQMRVALPGASVFVSCTTLAGREAAEAKLRDIVDGVFYAPVDYVFAMRRVIRRIRPAVVVVLETEIWPNLYREVKRFGCGLVIVNGRISDKALPKYRKWRWFFEPILRIPDRILVQSENQRRRYFELPNVEVGGNLKYDFDPSRATVRPDLREWLERDRGPLWIAASTVAPEFEGDTDEDDAVIAALPPGFRLLVAPRKPERFEVVAKKLESAGLDFAKRSQLSSEAPVLLLDSVGELAGTFAYADVVFMGGTLAHRGGHNVLEPAACGKPIIVGPHLENFAEIQAQFRKHDGFHEIAGASDLGPAVLKFAGDAGLGLRAKALAESERGATRRAVAAIVESRWNAVPRNVHWGLSVLSKLWLAGGRIKRSATRTERLPRPVISVGGLSMGGAGKTPVVRYLVEALTNPAVLTRGYRRETPERVTVIPRGSSAPVSLTGDEAQTILRDGRTHLGIGADRYEVGKAVFEQLQPDIFVLDDGFQHARVHRDLDIVVLDGLDPFGGGVFPLGTLREHPSALRRADLILITRAEGRRFDGVVREIRCHTRAPILLAETVPTAVVSLENGDRRSPVTLRGVELDAFCGLGNPEAFRQTLLALGVRLRSFRAFPDHYRYTQQDHLSGITTEKDAVKLQASGAGEIHYLETQIRITDIVWPG